MFSIMFNRWAVEDFLRLQCMTRAHLASRAGIAPGYVSDLLNGKKATPSRSAIRKLASALEVNPRSLYFEPAEVAA